MNKLKEITELSNKINKNDNHKILKMMKEHIEEIEERYNNNDEHWTIETADLIVLCFELLLMENKDIVRISAYQFAGRSSVHVVT